MTLDPKTRVFENVGDIDEFASCLDDYKTVKGYLSSLRSILDKYGMDKNYAHLFIGMEKQIDSEFGKRMLEDAGVIKND